MVAGTRRAFAAVILSMAVLFAFTGFLVRAWRSGRSQRANRHFEMGRQLAQQGRSDQAVEEYRAALSFSPNDTRYRLALALALMSFGRLDEAEAHLGELRESDPTNAVVNLALARISVRQHDWDEAVLDYHRAIFGLWPEQPEKNRVQARFELVDLLMRRQKQKEVLAELLELAAETPGDTAVQRRVASLLLANGAARNAADLYQSILTASPEDAAAWSGLGEAQFVQGDYPAARASFRKALRWNSKDEQARKGVAECDEIAALDPTQPTLSSGQRFGRARELLARSFHGLEGCLAASGGNTPADVSTLVESARPVVDAKPRRHREGDTPKVLALAGELWESWDRLCPAAARADQAVAIVMGKVSN